MLLESGGYLLLEGGDALLLEDGTPRSKGRQANPFIASVGPMMVR